MCIRARYQRRVRARHFFGTNMPRTSFNERTSFRKSLKMSPDLVPTYIAMFGGVLLASAASFRTLQGHNELVLNKRANETGFLDKENPKFMSRETVFKYLPQEMTRPIDK
eukprot:TRINITY_DN830_c0_g1_i1.p1 TRINITY_DN830_c0_g1~~TRINITY_DN830_c0_g1_i1.p1  ORF type:complete len:110 (+),score=34.91 TRINITY_DN830_c0_g1_i1:3-332(+)